MITRSWWPRLTGALLPAVPGFGLLRNRWRLRTGGGWRCFWTWLHPRIVIAVCAVFWWFAVYCVVGGSNAGALIFWVPHTRWAIFCFVHSAFTPCPCGAVPAPVLSRLYLGWKGGISDIAQSGTTRTYFPEGLWRSRKSYLRFCNLRIQRRLRKSHQYSFGLTISFALSYSLCASSSSIFFVCWLQYAAMLQWFTKHPLIFPKHGILTSCLFSFTISVCSVHLCTVSYVYLVTR